MGELCWRRRPAARKKERWPAPALWDRADSTYDGTTSPFVGLRRPSSHGDARIGVAAPRRPGRSIRADAPLYPATGPVLVEGEQARGLCVIEPADGPVQPFLRVHVVDLRQ